MAQNKVIVELSVLDPNLTEESPGKENIDYTITTPLDQKKKLLGDGEKYTSLSNLSSFLHFKSETGAILFIDIVTQLFVFRIFVDVVWTDKANILQHCPALLGPTMLGDVGFVWTGLYL